MGKGKKVYPDGRAKFGYWEDGKFIEGDQPDGKSSNNGNSGFGAPPENNAGSVSYAAPVMQQ